MRYINAEDLVHEALQWDSIYWEHVLYSVPAVRKLLVTRLDKTIAGDMFLSLYKLSPEIREDASDPALASWFEMQETTPYHAVLRESTVGDKEMSAYGAVRLFQLLKREGSLRKVLSIRHTESTPGVSGNPVMQDMMKQAQKELGEDIKTHKEPLNGTPSPDPYRNSQQQSLTAMEVTQIKQELDNLQESFDQLSSTDGGDMGMGGGNSTRHLILDKILGANGFEVGGAYDLRRLTDAIGRVENWLKLHKGVSLPTSSVPPIGTEMGQDLERVLPQELGLLGDEDLEDLFWKRYEERSLMQYEREKSGDSRGPFVCLLDMSGSMSRVKRDISAVFFIMAKEALSQNREVVLIPFANQTAGPFRVSSLGDLMDLALRGAEQGWKIGGGTDYGMVLSEAMQAVGNFDRRADLLMITDGNGGISMPTLRKRFGEWKTESGVRMFGLFIGSIDIRHPELYDWSLDTRLESWEWIDELKEAIA